MKAICLLFLFAVAFADDEEPVVKSDSIELIPGGEEVVLQSPNYPEDAPAFLQYTWKLSTTEGNVIQIDCEDIRLFEETPCGDWVLTLTDGEKKDEVCTSVFDYSKVSETNSLELVLKTGDADRGFLSCVAKAVPK